MAENILLFDDFNTYPTPTSDEQVLRVLHSEATAKKIPAADNETTTQRSERLRLQNEENRKVKDAADFYKAAERNPSLANKLYNIREAGKNTRPQTHSELKVDNEGNPYLKIYRQMEGGFFDFSIHDGKVVFNGKMDDARMAEALDFLFRRGISNFELPQGIDENFAETFRQAQTERLERSEALAAAPANDAQITFSSPINQDEITPQGWKNPSVEEKKNFEKDVSDFENWLGDANQKKKNGLSYFKHNNLNGSVEFSVYNSEDENNYKNDGKKDKNGVAKETCAYRVKLTQKDGKLNGIQFHIPNDGKIPDALADKFAAMIKAQGATFMNFPEGLAPSDAGVFRLACARAGIIPTGIGINKFQAQKMIGEAENNIQDEKDLYKYKGQLGKHLLRLSQNDPKDPRYTQAMSLINQEKLFPLKQQLEGCLTDKLTERVNGGKAEEVIGAATTMKQLFTSISANPDMSMEQLCQKLAPQDQAFQTELLQKLKNAGANEQTASSLNDAQMVALYESLEIKNIEEAKKTLVDRINRNKGKDSVDTIVEREVNSASKALNITINKGLKDKGFKDGFSTIDFGSPTFEVPADTHTNTRYAAPLRTVSNREL